MQIVAVDERDSGWEDSHPRFRVSIFEGDGPSYDVETYDVTDADALDAIRWAQAKAGKARLYAVALVTERSSPDGDVRGLTWLVGSDANDRNADISAMRARRDRPPVGPGG